MALIARKLEETVSVVQEAGNGEFLTLFDLAEFATSCHEVGIQGDAGVQVKCEPNGSAVSLATRATFDRSEDDLPTDTAMRRVKA